jgi:signal transduction histidine kinase
LEPTAQFVSEEDWLKFIHPDDRENVNSIIKQGKSGWLGAAYQYRIVRPDGAIRHLYAVSRYKLDEAGNPIGIYGINHDITDRVKLEEQLHEQQRKEQLRLTEVTLEAQEKERNAIGRELHDNVNQILTGTLIILSTLNLRHDKMEEVLELAMKHLKNAVEENRKIAHELVSPDFAGQKLIDEISVIANTMLKGAGMEVVINASGFDEASLNAGLKLALYRVLQEQCTNIVKHSHAKNVSIGITNEKQTLKMTITDDGEGMDTQKKTDGIGLRNIKSRLSVYHGSVEMQTSPGKGFALIITIPIS